MSPVVYTAVKRFDPKTCGCWADFVATQKLPHVREIVSLDESLCPNLFHMLVAEDWKHNVQANNHTHLFHNVEHVCTRVDRAKINVLALIEEPSKADVLAFQDPRFDFCGFDLIEDGGSISALTNCGGFEKAFRQEELSSCGLLVDYARAVAVQGALRREYPEEPHAQCRMWAIWRLRG